MDLGGCDVVNNQYEDLDLFQGFVVGAYSTNGMHKVRN